MDSTNLSASAGRRVWVEATVIRADGTREDLGVVASSDPDGPGAIHVMTSEQEADHG